MSDDLVTRLRMPCIPAYREQLDEAADEIEQLRKGGMELFALANKYLDERNALRAALEMIATHRDGQCDNGYSAEFVARAALREEKNDSA